ncbi:MAG: error-prone DNA polymerase [bacterium]
MSSYVPLWCKSGFSFLEGASQPAELVGKAHELGLPALTITDRDGVYGIVRAHVKARELGLPLIIGSQVTLDDGSLIVLLVQSREGYAGLCRLLTAGRLRSPKGECSVSWREVCSHAPGLIALWGGAQWFGAQRFGAQRPGAQGGGSKGGQAVLGGLGSLLTAHEAPQRVAGALKDAFGDRLYALVARHRQAEEVHAEARLRRRAARWRLPIVAATEVLYHTPERRRLQDTMTCVRHGATLRGAGRLLRPNAGHALRPARAFARLFRDDAAAVARTLEVAGRCAFSLDELRYRYPSERLPDGTTSAQWLHQLAMEGARWRYPQGVPPAVTAQLEKELKLIEELDYPGYFLTMWEIVRFCRERGILCQGRGSAANSAVCYCLGVTEVDPARIDLLFERFISRERAEPPDIDLDIEHNRREEVIQHVYQKYGRSHAAMVANIIRYRTKSALRDVGKVLGLPEAVLDRMSKLSHSYESLSPEVLVEAGASIAKETAGHLLRLAAELQDFPRHLSIHPGGFLLGHEPVHDLVPIENATMQDRTVIQWDKEDVEAMGLFKVDLLGLGALTLMALALKMLERLHGRPFSMATLPSDDPATYDMLCRGDTVGVFQVESRAQMAMLGRLRPRKFYDLVIEISIVRPGPITGGMVHPYLRRRNGEEVVEYPHPSLEPVLRKTLGIPLFQEQVMKLAMVAADYTPGEADRLRRDMAAWRHKGNMDGHHERLVSRMVKKGIAAEFAERVFAQIKGFGDYGFPESHAASFALIAYATAWLKCHHPEVFACTLLNAQPMGFYSPATIVGDARRHGVVVRPVDVAYSDWDCILEEPHRQRPALRMGLRYIKGLAEEAGRSIERERKRAPFSDIGDLIARSGVDEKGSLTLATAGAFGGLAPSRRAALWQVRGEKHLPKPSLPLPETEAPPAFAPLDSFEKIAWDRFASSHSARGHPLAPLRAELRRLGLPDARGLNEMANGATAHYAGMVINRQRPGTAKGVIFMTLEDESGFVNLVLWENVFRQHYALAKTQPFLGVTGTLQSESGVVHLIVQHLWQPATTRRPNWQPSRDFH